MPRMKTLKEWEIVTVRFPKGVLEVLRQSAQEHDRSLNAEIVNAARRRTQEYQAEKGTVSSVLKKD